MAALTATPIFPNGGEIVPTVNTLTASDTFAFANVDNKSLLFINGTGAQVTINLLGDNVSNVNCPGIGQPIDTSGGYDIIIPDGEQRLVAAKDIYAYLTDTNNTPAITGGENCTCYFFEY